MIIDNEALVRFASELVGIPSVLGGEGPVAERAAQEMRRLGYEHLGIDRYGNVSGVITGDSEGPTLLLDAHLELVDSYRNSIRDIGATIEALSAAASFEAIDAALGGSAFNDAQNRINAACNRLEEKLLAEGAAAALNCRDG